jgi:hypothetical protein
MKRISSIGQLGLVGIVVTVLSLTFGTTVALAETPAWLCVPKTAGQAATSGGTSGEGTCGAETTKVDVSILSHMKYVESGIDSKPTIEFEGVNVQLVNGAGKTATTNGEGNLVIGYDEQVGRSQTGSHNLILGFEQTFTSYGGILAGYKNFITAGDASVTGGVGNKAEGIGSSVSGGSVNHAKEGDSSVSGGDENTASGPLSSISGGRENNASGVESSISGGRANKAEGVTSSIGGGFKNETSNEFSVVGGGSENKASGKYASVFGNKLMTASREFEALL